MRRPQKAESATPKNTKRSAAPWLSRICAHNEVESDNVIQISWDVFRSGNAESAGHTTRPHMARVTTLGALLSTSEGISNWAPSFLLGFWCNGGIVKISLEKDFCLRRQKIIFCAYNYQTAFYVWKQYLRIHRSWYLYVDGLKSHTKTL